MALKSYIVAFDNSDSHRSVIESFDKNEKIKDWYTCLPNAVFLISELDAKQLAISIFNSTKLKKFIVISSDTDRNGFLPERAWKFLRNKETSQKTK